MIGLMTLLIGCGGLPTGLSQSKSGDQVFVDPSWQACQVDADCMVVDSSCSECCEQQVIAVDRAAEWRAAFASACGRYDGPQCDCVYTPIVAACRQNLCWPLIPPQE